MQQALVVARDGAVVYESYERGFDASAPHALYSGTKSFWGIAAIEARRDGLFDLDEHVRSGYTVRMLLDMTAGYGFGGLGSAVPTYERALEIPLKNAPGSKFTYSGIPLQVFGAFFAERLRARAMTPHEYLRVRVLEPAGVEISSWRTLKDGTHPLPTGAFLTARNWLAYGTYVLAQRERYRDAFAGSAVNPRYGLCWWLSGPKMPPDLFYASGSGGQALYAIASQRLVAVRFSDGGSPNHPATVKKLLTFTT
ncbi:MAG TPA: serine hydrolase domain-containing protein [Candidatus Acidoferrales bacterium]|nr:serine hydrolase domain-containing protein [Candidatus Acidoferrales bacterium]